MTIVEHAVAEKLDSRPNIRVPLAGTCPRCLSRDVQLEADNQRVYIVHDLCRYRGYAGPVSGLPATSPLALELALRP